MINMSHEYDDDEQHDNHGKIINIWHERENEEKKTRTEQKDKLWTIFMVISLSYVVFNQRYYPTW